MAVIYDRAFNRSAVEWYEYGLPSREDIGVDSTNGFLQERVLNESSVDKEKEVELLATIVGVGDQPCEQSLKHNQ